MLHNFVTISETKYDVHIKKLKTVRHPLDQQQNTDHWSKCQFFTNLQMVCTDIYNTIMPEHGTYATMSKSPMRCFH